jgi:hypothetical protein
MEALAVREQIKKALLNKSPLMIEKYTSSSGGVSDYCVRFLPAGGYMQLVRESVDAVEQGKLEKPVEFSLAVWHEAINEKLNSWRNTLTGNTKTRKFAAELQPHTDGFWFDPHLGEDHIILRNLLCEDKSTVIEAPSAPARRQADKTKAKEYIEKHTPVGGYIGQMNLYPGKFESAKAVV